MAYIFICGGIGIPQLLRTILQDCNRSRGTQGLLVDGILMRSLKVHALFSCSYMYSDGDPVCHIWRIQMRSILHYWLDPVNGYTGFTYDTLFHQQRE